MEVQMIKDDRAYGGNRASIDLTPTGLWGKPILDAIGDEGYALLQASVAERAGHACELCGASDKIKGIMGKCAHKFKMEPRFQYEERTGCAKLKRLMHICNQCGQSIHLRQTELEGANMPQSRSPMIGAIARLMKFHDVSEDDVRRKLSSELQVWATREILFADFSVATDAVSAIRSKNVI